MAYVVPCGCLRYRLQRPVHPSCCCVISFPLRWGPQSMQGIITIGTALLGALAISVMPICRAPGIEVLMTIMGIVPGLRGYVGEYRWPRERLTTCSGWLSSHGELHRREPSWEILLSWCLPWSQKIPVVIQIDCEIIRNGTFFEKHQVHECLGMIVCLNRLQWEISLNEFTSCMSYRFCSFNHWNALGGEWG